MYTFTLFSFNIGVLKNKTGDQGLPGDCKGVLSCNFRGHYLPQAIFSVKLQWKKNSVNI